MCQSFCDVVHSCCYEYRHRFCYHHSPNANHWVIEPSQTAKTSVDRYLRSWWFVSYPTPMTTLAIIVPSIYICMASDWLQLLTSNSVCLVSILRLKSLVAVSKSTDLTYDNAPAAMWSSVEVNIGIISACLPTLRPFAARYISSFASRSDTSQPTLGQWQRQHDQQSQRNIDLPTRNSQHKSNITVVHDFVVTSSKSDLNEIDDNGSDEVHILPQRSESRLCWRNIK